MSSTALVRPIMLSDRDKLNDLVASATYIHRHLDWHTPIDWVGSAPFLGIERRQRLVAALACPFVHPSVAWVRLFAYLDWSPIQLSELWQQLFFEVCDSPLFSRPYTLAALGLSPWFVNVLLKSKFMHYQNIVVLQYVGDLPAARPFPQEAVLRPMQAADLTRVLSVDNTAFEPLWQHTFDELQLAFHQAVYATVIELGGEIVAYQISSGNEFHAHLARLAVEPGLQRLSFGFHLVHDLLTHCLERETFNITVNTQSDNLKSLALYQKLAFQSTGDDYPVFTYPLD